MYTIILAKFYWYTDDWLILLKVWLIICEKKSTFLCQENKEKFSVWATS